jgi:anti-sigma regulatory factor (Ser/Thr protein kinase)
MSAQVCVTVTELSQVGEVRRAAARLAHTIPLSDARRSDVAIIATELATNLARYARHGQVWLQTLSTAEGVFLEIIAIDSGPGMSDLHRCLQDGYSSAGSAGTGLGAVRRLADEFDAFSTVGRGTTVMTRLHATPAPSPRLYIVGAVSLPAPGETVCGDAWRIVERDQSIAIMVADGLGHGPLAAEAAERAAEVFVAQAFNDTSDFYVRAHERLRGSRGAAVARAVIDGSGRVEYSSVGNVAGSLVGLDASRGLPSQNGTVGLEMRRQIATQQYEWPGRGILLMYSDGILGRWSLEPYPGLLVRHPALIAAILFRDFLRGRDDATMVVIGRSNKGAGT